MSKHEHSHNHTYDYTANAKHGSSSRKHHKKKGGKFLPIFIGILCFVVGCVASSMFFSGLAVDLVSQIKNGSTKSEEVASTDSKKVYVRTEKKQALAMITFSAPATGVLQPVGGNRMNFQLTPGLAVGSSSMSDEKVVYLTFDDGPSSNTQGVLDVLDKYNAKATFFVTGMNPDYFGLIKTAADKGHTIGLHTMCHDYAQVYASEDAYFNDLEKIGNLVKEQIGYVPCFIRFPGGSSNTVSSNYSSGIMSRLSQDVIAKGYQYYDWNGDSEDGSGTLSPDALYSHAINASGSNIMILCHDARGKETTVQALSKIIEHYQAQGYAFRGIDRESYAPHHGINN